MLSNLFKERYGKLLIGFCFVVLFMYISAGWQSQKAWHQQERYLASEEFIKDFNENREYYVKSYNGETPVYFDSAAEYRDAALTINKEYSDEIYYNHPYMTTMNQFVIVFLFLIGFLSFFVDGRTHFNRFLFALPFSRKQVFRKKLLFIGLPLTACLLLGLLGHILIEYAMIPARYLAVPLQDVLLSALSTLATNLLVFATGLLLGVLLGNLFTGVLSVFFTISLGSMGYSFFQCTREFFSFVFLGHGDFLLPFQTWIDWPQGYVYPWWLLLLYLGLSGWLILAAEKVFSKISLENDGDYLTIPKLRAPVYWLLSLGTWFYLSMISYYPLEIFYRDLYEGYDVSLWNIALRLGLLLVACLFISLLLVYPKALMNWWYKRKNKQVSNI